MPSGIAYDVTVALAKSWFPWIGSDITFILVSKGRTSPMRDVLASVTKFKKPWMEGDHKSTECSLPPAAFEELLKAAAAYNEDSPLEKDFVSLVLVLCKEPEKELEKTKELAKEPEEPVKAVQAEDPTDQPSPGLLRLMDDIKKVSIEMFNHQ